MNDSAQRHGDAGYRGHPLNPAGPSQGHPRRGKEAQAQGERIAQTNLQLYLQLIGDRWSDEALRQVQNAYELALRLFACQVRPNRKPFICHLLGTASVAAMQCDDSDVVTASLLHAAYASGDWGDRQRGCARSRRDLIEELVGNVAETLLFQYTIMEWNYQTGEVLLPRVAAMGEIDRAVVLMRLANEVDEWLDGGLRFSSKGEFLRFQPDNVKNLVTLAQRLGYLGIAELLDQLAQESESLVVPPCLRTDTSATSGMVVLPQAPLVRLAVRINSKVDKVGASLSRDHRHLIRRRAQDRPKLDAAGSQSLSESTGGS